MDSSAIHSYYSLLSIQIKYKIDDLIQSMKEGKHSVFVLGVLLYIAVSLCTAVEPCLF